MIYNEDCCEGLKKIESADVIICDPPYNIGKDYGNNKRKENIADYVKWCETWLDLCIEKLNPGGTIFVYGFAENLAHISVALDLPHRWLTWHYTNKTVPSLNFWQRSSEHILVGWKDTRTFYRDEVREPYTDTFMKLDGKPRKATKGRFSNGEKDTSYTVNKKGALPRDVIKISALAGGAGSKEVIGWCEDCQVAFIGRKEHKEHKHWVHPTQKPMALTEKLLLSCSKPGDRLIVPFAGSGSELLVANKLGLNWDAFEINPEYCKIIRELT